MTGRRLLDIKSATNQAEDWGGTLENGMFSIQAFEPIGQGNFLTRRGAETYATIRIIVRYTRVHPGPGYIFTFRWDEEFDASWRGEDLVTGDVTDIRRRGLHPNAGYAGIPLRSRDHPGRRNQPLLLGDPVRSPEPRNG